VYRLNPTLGTVERATQSLGPFFTERAPSAGRYQASFGMTLQQLHFTSLDGRSLRDGSLVTTANKFTDEAAPFDVDQLTLNIDASVATLYATWGPIGSTLIAAPFVARRDGTRVDTYRGRVYPSQRQRAPWSRDLWCALSLYSDESEGPQPWWTRGCRPAARKTCWRRIGVDEILGHRVDRTAARVGARQRRVSIGGLARDQLRRR
jgi:hypothetical protein